MRRVDAAGADDGVAASRATQARTAHEPRTAARVIVRDRAGLLLLFQGVDPAVPDALYWFTPGGGLDSGETYEQAAARELQEEAGLKLTAPGEVVREDEVEFGFEGVTYRQRQRYFAVEVPIDGAAIEVDLRGWTEDERRSMTACRWWSLSELEVAEEDVYPTDLAALVRSIRRWGSAVPAYRVG